MNRRPGREGAENTEGIGSVTLKDARRSSNRYFIFSISSLPSDDCTLNRKQRLARITTSRTSTNATLCVLGEVVASPTVTNVSFCGTLLRPTNQRSRPVAPRAITRKGVQFDLDGITGKYYLERSTMIRRAYAVPIPTFPQRSCCAF